MERNLRWVGVAGGARAGGFSLVAPYFFLYLRNILHLGYAEVGALVALTGILPLALVPFAGLLADRVGRRRVFVVCLCAEALAVLLVADGMRVHWLLGILVFVTLVQTVGALAGPALSAYIADFAEGSERTLAFTWARIGWNVGFTVGVFSGGALIGWLGFPDVGFLAGGVLLGSTTLVALALEPSPFDRSLAARRAHPSAAPAARPSVRATTRRLLNDRVFLAFCAAVAVAQLTVAQWSVTFPLYVNSVLGVPYAWIGAGLAVNGLLVVFAQAPTTRTVLGRRHTTLMMLGTALYAAGYLLIGGLATAGFAVVAGFFLAVVVLTTGENVVSIPASTLPSNLAPPSDLGAYNGMFYAVSGVGSLLAPALGGLVLSLGASPLVTWSWLVVPSVPAIAALGLYVGPRVALRANTA